MNENVDLKKRKVYNERRQKELDSKNKSLETQLQNMRQFVIHLSKDLEIYKKKDIRESKFWKSIKNSNILQDSEPPIEL